MSKQEEQGVRNWYAIHTYAGYESVVLRNLRQRIDSLGMNVTDDSWYVVRNTPRVTGFVGAGVIPVPLKNDEVEYLFKKMNAGTAKHNIDMVIGERILITDGPFKELEGKV